MELKETFPVGKVFTSRLLKKEIGSCYKDSFFSPYLECLPRERGKMQSFKILKELPPLTEIREALALKYTIQVQGAVEDVASEIESIAEELSSWYDSIPENLQNGDKAQEVESAKDSLESFYLEEAPEGLEDCKVVIYPDWDGGNSRKDRLCYAVSILNSVAEAVEEFIQVEEENGDFDELDTLREWKDAVENAASDVDSVEIPGMF